MTEHAMPRTMQVGASAAGAPFTFQDWQDGRRPPKGFDIADAVEFGWSMADVRALMMEVVSDQLEPFPDIYDAKEPVQSGEHEGTDMDGFADLQARSIEVDPEHFDAPPGPPAPTNRPTIHFVESELPMLVNKACEALVDADVEVFARGTTLVRPVSLASAGQHRGVRRRQGATILSPIDETAMVELLTSHIDWSKYDLRKDNWRPIAAPAMVAKTILARRGDWPFPQLVAVVTAPTLRADWTVLQQPGFDLASGIYFASAGVEWPAIPAKPSRADATAALALFNDLLSDFPFVSASDTSGALAMILTALVRPSLPTAPLFGVSAPVPGSGKSKLIDIGGILATGRNAAVMSAPREEQELQKSIGAALMAGDGFLNLDNIEHPLRSEFLCQVLTQEMVKTRVLGQSLNLDLPTAVTICATGNGLRFEGDLTRRVVLITLDPGMERPEERIFERDALAIAARDRVKLVVAGLTILRAYALSGAAPVRPALGSFEVWSNTIRSALLWLGLADPLANANRVRDDDPERERTSAIIHALPRGKWTVAEIAEMLRSDAQRTGAGQQHTAMAEALGEFMGYGDKLDVQGFGKFLRKHQDRIIDGMRIIKDGVRHKVALWRIDRMKGEPDQIEF